jgi:uncharacterized protein YndB with AHSA1/START domain
VVDLQPEATSGREIVSARVLDAPRALVWEAISNPEHLRRWWGPAGFSNTFHEFDFTPGGAWRFVMHGPDGSEFENESVFLAIEEPERIVFRHLMPVHVFVMTMRLEDRGEQTALTWRMEFESAEEADKVRAFVEVANQQNLDRLAAVVAGLR